MSNLSFKRGIFKEELKNRFYALLKLMGRILSVIFLLHAVSVIL